MSTTIQIALKGQIHAFNRRLLTFEVIVETARKLLEGKVIDSTFDALHEGLAETWLLRDDVVYPFGDRRQNLRSVCTFDLDRDILFYTEEEDHFPYTDGMKLCHLQIPLSRLRKSDSTALQRSEFTSFEPDVAPIQDLSAFSPPYQKPLAPVPAARFAFTSRILEDFSHQWRHVLRSRFSDPTFRRFARAIISIATCSFRVEEISSRGQALTRGPIISVLDLPTWKPYDDYIFDVGHTTVILNQDLAMGLAKAKAKSQADEEAAKDVERSRSHRYLLFSIRHIVLCHSDAPGQLVYTEPLSFMDGVAPPSRSAITILLQALLPSRPCPYTPVHRLPLELQDRVLENVSIGSFEAARLGCVLGLGSLYKWTRAKDWPRRDGPVEIFTSPSHRTDLAPVESKIYFGDVFSGTSYR